ncbi:P-loop containing nucleoside triphosphate hydrolase protein [Trichoderma sp. SZMC 28011]
MEAVSDLFGQEESKLLKELRRLSKLSDERKIEAPSLIVVGDQNSGKSSVLEALTRFRFPVSDGVCTTFPIRLVLQRSAADETYVTSPILKRQQISPPGNEDEVQQSTQEAIEKYQESIQAKPNASNTAQDSHLATQGGSKTFSAGVVEIERHGPDVPFLEITDLPGLFISTNSEQDEAGLRIVQDIAKSFIKSERNVVILVIQGRSQYVNQMAPGLLRKLMKKYRSLKHRTVGVITNADDERCRNEVNNLINGNLDRSEYSFGWHVLRNQSREERLTNSLNDRDRVESEFFNSEEWNSIDSDRKGIEGLRATLRKVFRNHILKQLPQICDEICGMITKTENQISELGPQRSSTEDNRRFLSDIARKFEQLAREAVQGTYNNPRCRQLHPFLSEECPTCLHFFPEFHDNDTESQVKRLRATARFLNREFSKTMHDCGKTRALVEDGLTNGIASPVSDANVSEDTDDDESHKSTTSSARQANDLSSGRTASFPPSPSDTSDDLSSPWFDGEKKFHKTKPIARKEFERKVMPLIERWRAGEPRGEASDAAFGGLFEYQSANWEAIARDHVGKVWSQLHSFNDFALEACCGNSDVLQSIKKYIISPRLEDLRIKADLLLRKLLSCHRRGNTGFNDAFTDVVLLRKQSEAFALRLTEALRASSDENEVELVDQIISSFHKQFTSESFAALKLGDPITDKIMKWSTDIVIDAFKGNKPPPETKNLDSIGLYPEALERFAATRVIDQVEARYLMTMIAFVGYVNSLVVDEGLLGELPDSVFTQQIIMNTDDVTINNIAAESPRVAEQRAELQAELDVLKSVYEVAQHYRFSTARE